MRPTNWKRNHRSEQFPRSQREVTCQRERVNVPTALDARTTARALFSMMDARRAFKFMPGLYLKIHVAKGGWRRRVPQPSIEAVKKPVALSTKESARVFCGSLWSISVGLFFRSFQLVAASFLPVDNSACSPIP